MKSKYTLIFAMAALVFFTAIPLNVSAEEPAKALLTINQADLTVGDPIEITLSVLHPADQQVILPQLDSNWGDFLIYGQSPPSTISNDDGTEITSQVIDARLFAPGSYTTPPLNITISDSDGDLSEVSAAPIDVAIGSVLIEGDTQLRDIKPQAELPYVNILPWIFGGSILAGLVVAFLYMKRKRQAKLALAAQDNRFPHEVALDELERIAGLSLPQQGRFKDFYTLVSDSIRDYMEQIYQIPVLERTTGEIRLSMKHAHISPDVARNFIEFLGESDLVKFSKFMPDVESANLLLEQAHEIIDLTKPVEPIIDTETSINTSKDISSGSGYSPTGKINTNSEVIA